MKVMPLKTFMDPDCSSLKPHTSKAATRSLGTKLFHREIAFLSFTVINLLFPFSQFNYYDLSLSPQGQFHYTLCAKTKYKILRATPKSSSLSKPLPRYKHEKHLFAFYAGMKSSLN